MPFERLWQGAGTLSDAELEHVVALALRDPAIMELAHQVAADERVVRQLRGEATLGLHRKLDEEIQRFSLTAYPQSVWQDWTEIRAHINRYMDVHWLADLLSLRKGQWTLETERYYFDMGTNKEGEHVGFWAWREFVRKDNGTTVRISSHGRSDDEHQKYRYDDGTLSIEISAFRYDRDGNLTDTFNVWMPPTNPWGDQSLEAKAKGFLPAETTRTQALAIASDIREALLALPPERTAHKGLPATAVSFDWSHWNKGHPDAQILGNPQ